ncbi:hypothetical protein [Pseudomonas sp.]|uniref:hypothetical protein n=1 Tax=Pseudomonas sp. TaxID=306 RepID=UPI004053CEBC
MTEKTAKSAIWLGLALALVGSPAAFAETAAKPAADCAVAEFTMGLRFQQQSAEVQALQL